MTLTDKAGNRFYDQQLWYNNCTADNEQIQHEDVYDILNILVCFPHKMCTKTRGLKSSGWWNQESSLKL